MAEHRAQDQLHVKNRNRKAGQGHQAWAPCVLHGVWLMLDPVLSGEQSNHDGNAEEGLGDRRVRRRDGSGEVVKNRESAQYALNDHSGEGGEAKFSNPRALVGAPGPDRDDDREETDELRDHAVRVLESHTADHSRNLVNRTERRRPVRNRKARVITGDEGARDQQQKSYTRLEHGKALLRPVIRCDGVLQKRPLPRNYTNFVALTPREQSWSGPGRSTPEAKIVPELLLTGGAAATFL